MRIYCYLKIWTVVHDRSFLNGQQKHSRFHSKLTPVIVKKSIVKKAHFIYILNRLLFVTVLLALAIYYIDAAISRTSRLSRCVEKVISSIKFYCRKRNIYTCKEYIKFTVPNPSKRFQFVYLLSSFWGILSEILNYLLKLDFVYWKWNRFNGHWSITIDTKT